MVHECLCSCNAKLWPVVLFFHIIDEVEINTFIVLTWFYENFHKGKAFQRRLFLHNLVLIKILIKPFVTLVLNICVFNAVIASKFWVLQVCSSSALYIEEARNH